MNVKKLLLSMVALLTISTVAHGQQPFGGCWHPEHIKVWTPEKDPNAKFNKSTVPLQPRFEDVNIKANVNQYYDGKVVAYLKMNPMSSRTPSQGANNFVGYNPTYWQYMDILAWCGGSADEGIITPPSAPAIDVAHLNGVKILGAVFFPFSQGGQTKWVEEMTKKENDVYPYARKLFDIAVYYGFDGWHLSGETGGASVETWTEFVQDYMTYAASKGVTQHEIQWFQESAGIGKFSDMMKIKGSSCVLNYGSAKLDNIPVQMSTIEKLGYTKSEAFSKLYFGIACAMTGLGGNGVYFNNLFPKDGHTGSIYLYGPEEHSWNQEVKDLLNTPNASGDKAYTAMNNVFKNEARFWTNRANDPCNVSGRSGSDFPGLANAVVERTAIQSKPFVTSFSVGLGKARYLDGQKKVTQDWYHRGMQSVLPTWRWWFDALAGGEEKTLSAKYNWNDAYNFGTSIKISGRLTADTDNVMRLYKTKLAIASGDKLELVYKTAHAGTVEVKLGVVEDKNEFTTFQISNTTSKNGWTVAAVDLSSLSEKTVSIIALNFKTAKAISNYSVLLGQLGIMAGSYAPADIQVTNLKIQNDFAQLTGDARLVWDAPATKDLHHYNVYMERGGKKQLVGQTRNEGFYVPKFYRSSQTETSVKFYVAAVTKDMKEGTSVVLNKDYPEIERPNVTIKASKTIIKTGEKVTLVARADNFPTGYKWETPNGATLVRQKNDTAIFKINEEGLYDFQVTVSNKVGSTIEKTVGLVDVSNSKVLKLISANKKIHSASGSFPPEIPEWLIDGVQVPKDISDKWCVGGKNEHWVIIDLEEVYNLYRFRIFDCGNKEEKSKNFKNYKIWTAVDIESDKWTLLVDETNRLENTKDDYARPALGRYVKFMPYDQDNLLTVRIWEFEVFGIEGELKLTVPDKSSVNVNSSLEQKASFSLGRDTKQENFTVTVTSSDNDLLSVSDLNVNDKGSITYNLKAGSEMGVAKITVFAKNGLYTKTKTYDVQILNRDLSNILSGIKPLVETGMSPLMDISDNNIGIEGITDGKENTYWRTSNYPSDQKHSVTFELDDLYEVSYIKMLFVPNQVNPVQASLPDEIKVYISDTDDGFFQLIKTLDTPLENNQISVPSSKPILVKQMKIVFTVPMSSNSGACLREVEAFGKKFSGTKPVPKVSLYTPLLNLTGFNADVIAESKPSASSTTSALEDRGWVFYSSSIKKKGSLPADRKLKTVNKTPFELAPYNGNNALMIRGIEGEGTLVFKNKEKALKMFVLGTSANGNAEVKLVVNYADGTKTDSKFMINDWWSHDATGAAIYNLGRILRAKEGDLPADKIESEGQYRMMEAELDVDPAKEIVSLTVKKVPSQGIVSIFGITKLLRVEKSSNIDFTKQAAALSVWPNPIESGGTLNVASSGIETIRLIDLQGTILFEEKANGEVTSVVLGTIAPGAYLLQVVGIKGISTQKVIVR